MHDTEVIEVVLRMIWKTLLIGRVVFAVIISGLYMLAWRMNLRIVFFIEWKILNGLHNIALTKMNHSFDVIHESLMLYLCRLIDSLLDLDRVLIDLSSQLSCDLYLDVSVSDVVLQDKEHGFVGLQQDAILMHVHILGWDRVLPDIGRIDDAETVLDQDGLV